MPSPPVRMILYQCCHELPDPRYQSPKKPSVLKRVKRALTFTDIIRTPSADFCPFCQRLEDEQAERDAAAGLTRLVAPPRRRISPILEHAAAVRRSNTVAVANPRTSPVTDTGTEVEPQVVDPLPSTNPYGDINTEDITADYMEWSRMQGLSDETAADRHARELRERLVRREWRAMDAAREYNEFVLEQGAEPAQEPAPAETLSELFSQAQEALAPVLELASMQIEQGSLRTRMEERKAEKAEKAERVRNRAQEIAKK